MTTETQEQIGRETQSWPRWKRIARSSVLGLQKVLCVGLLGLILSSCPECLRREDKIRALREERSAEASLLIQQVYEKASMHDGQTGMSLSDANRLIKDLVGYLPNELCGDDHFSLRPITYSYSSSPDAEGNFPIGGYMMMTRRGIFGKYNRYSVLNDWFLPESLLRKYLSPPTATPE